MTDINTPDLPATSLFFFFGSLRSGYWNNRILSSAAKFLGRARTVQPFALYIGRTGSVPTCTPEVGDVPMQGELWALNARDASSVYGLETGYEHGTFPVVLAEDNVVHQATIFYHSNPATCWYLAGGPQVIPSGDYTDAINPEGHQRPQPPAGTVSQVTEATA